MLEHVRFQQVAYLASERETTAAVRWRWTTGGVDRQRTTVLPCIDRAAGARSSFNTRVRNEVPPYETQLMGGDLTY